MGDAVGGGVEVEERGAVGGGRCAADTDADVVVDERSCNPAAHEPCNRVGSNAKRSLTSDAYFVSMDSDECDS